MLENMSINNRELKYYTFLTEFAKHMCKCDFYPIIITLYNSTSCEAIGPQYGYKYTVPQPL